MSPAPGWLGKNSSQSQGCTFGGRGRQSAPQICLCRWLNWLFQYSSVTNGQSEFLVNRTGAALPKNEFPAPCRFLCAHRRFSAFGSNGSFHNFFATFGARNGPFRPPPKLEDSFFGSAAPVSRSPCSCLLACLLASFACCSLIFSLARAFTGG